MATLARDRVAPTSKIGRKFGLVRLSLTDVSRQFDTLESGVNGLARFSGSRGLFSAVESGNLGSLEVAHPRDLGLANAPKSSKVALERRGFEK
jgi:hypothetical protein